MSKTSIFNKLVIYDTHRNLFLSSSKSNVQKNISDKKLLWMTTEDIYTFSDFIKNDVQLPSFHFIDIYRSNYKRFIKNTYNNNGLSLSYQHIEAILSKKRITKRDIALLPINNNTCYQLNTLFDDSAKIDNEFPHIQFSFPLSFGEKWNKNIPYFTDTQFNIKEKDDILSPVIEESPKPFLYVIYTDYTIAIIECVNKLEMLSKHLNLIYLTGYKNTKYKKIILAGEIVYNYTEKTIHYNFESGSIFGNIFFKNSELFKAEIFEKMFTDGFKQDIIQNVNNTNTNITNNTTNTTNTNTTNSRNIHNSEGILINTQLFIPYFTDLFMYVFHLDDKLKMHKNIQFVYDTNIVDSFFKLPSTRNIRLADMEDICYKIQKQSKPTSNNSISNTDYFISEYSDKNTCKNRINPSDYCKKIIADKPQTFLKRAIQTRKSHKLDLTPTRIMPKRSTKVITPTSPVLQTPQIIQKVSNTKVKDRTLFNPKVKKETNIKRRTDRNIKLSTEINNNNNVFI